MERRSLVLAAAVVALVGAALVFFYARGADARAEDRFGTTEVLVVTAPIAAGEPLASAVAGGKIASKPVSNDALLEGHQVDVTALEGAVALTPVYPGEQVVTAKFGAEAAASNGLQIPKNHVAVSVNLTDPARVAGFVSPNSKVAIYATVNGSEGADRFTQLLMPKVTVIGVGSTTPVSTTTTDQATGAETTEQLPRTLLTLALEPADAQRVLFAQGNGELSFVLLPADGSTNVNQGAETTMQNLFG